CFACGNAVAVPRHLPRIIYLHEAMTALRSALSPAAWSLDWAQHHARVQAGILGVDQYPNPGGHRGTARIPTSGAAGSQQPQPHDPGLEKLRALAGRSGITLLSTVDSGLLADYAVNLRNDGRRRDYCQRQLLALTRLWAYAPHLLPCDRIARPP